MAIKEGDLALDFYMLKMKRLDAHRKPPNHACCREGPAAKRLDMYVQAYAHGQSQETLPQAAELIHSSVYVNDPKVLFMVW